MSGSKKNIVFVVAMVLVVGLLAFLISLMMNFNNEPYRTKNIKQNNINMRYPYFHNKLIDPVIKDYLKSIPSKEYDEVNYKINYIDNFISILFGKYKAGKIAGYDYFIFNKDGKLENINSIISDENILKEKIKIYLDLNNIILDKYPDVDYYYFLKPSELNVILQNNNDGIKSFQIMDINYNEIMEILKLKFEYTDDYTKKLTTKAPTTTTTTTTTTKKIVVNDGGNKIIAFTFDDGPSKYTKDIMDILDKYGAKATFFEVGYMIKNRKEIVQEVLNRGFEIGNHTTDHSNLNKLSDEKVKEKVYGNNDTFKEITGIDFPLLRPPYGNCKTAIRDLIDVPIIKWSVDSRDWESRNTAKIVSVVKSQTKSGDIVLFHDLYPTTVEAIKILVPYYYENGYRIVSVSELFEQNGITLEKSKVYYDAR